MKKRLHDKKAGVAILAALIVISLLEVIFRVGCMRQSMLNTSNVGEPFATVVFAALIIFFTFKGKDRVCYLLYGAWIACFVMDQFFGLPGMIGNLVANISDLGMTISIVLRLLTMVCIIAIGALLVEYMSDGTIYNRAFNVFCVITVLLLAVDIYMGITGVIFAPSDGIENVLLKKQLMLVLFNNLYRMAMVFLFTFFAYDSAKMQLKKANLTK